MGSNIDLRHLQDNEDVYKAFSKIVSGGKAGYKAVIDRPKAIPKCPQCGKVLEGSEKFCPECGNKLV